jgi:hypothetical protein
MSWLGSELVFGQGPRAAIFAAEIGYSVIDLISVFVVEMRVALP